jgi:hypothetical protein
MKPTAYCWVHDSLEAFTPDEVLETHNLDGFVIRRVELECGRYVRVVQPLHSAERRAA